MHSAPAARTERPSTAAAIFQRLASWRELAPPVVAGVATLAALLLGLYALDRRSFWLDEATTYYVSDVGWDRLLELFAGEGHGWHPPTYIVLVKLWRVFGDSEAAVRSLSVVAAVLAIPAMYLLVRRIASQWIAAVATVLMASNAYFVQWSQEARTYLLTLLLTVVGYWLLVRALERSDLPRWAAYVAITVLALYSHLFYAFVVVAQGLTVAIHLASSPERRTAFWHALGSFIVIGILSVPLLLISASGSSDVLSWVGPFRWRDLQRTLFEFAGGTQPANTLYLVGGMLGLVALVVRPPKRHWTPLVLTWLVVPVALLVAVAILVKPVYVPRYLIMSLPALVIVLAMGLTLLPRLAAVAAVAVALVISMGGLTAWYTGPFADWRGVAAHLYAHGDATDAVVVWSDSHLKPLTYQGMHVPDPAELPTIALPAVEWHRNQYLGRESGPPQADPRLEQCAYERIWVVGGPRELDREESPRLLDLAQVLQQHYTLADTRDFGHDLRLYTRASDCGIAG